MNHTSECYILCSTFHSENIENGVDEFDFTENKKIINEALNYPFIQV